MYRVPEHNSDVVSQAIYATNVEVLKQKRKWIEIRTADHYSGWIESTSAKKQNKKPYAVDGVVVHVASLSANIYRDPDITAHTPLLNVPWETRLEVTSEAIDEEHHWLKIRLPDKREAYVQAGDVSKDFAPITLEQSIDLARKFLGITYTWGGTSAYGFDCSGFTQMLLRQRGIIMPRDADLQAAWTGALPVDRSDLREGDLLFFGSDPDKITHTGMYIGHGEFIHDTTHEHPMVQISRLDEVPWTSLLVGARRVK